MAAVAGSREGCGEIGGVGLASACKLFLLGQANMRFSAFGAIAVLVAIGAFRFHETSAATLSSIQIAQCLRRRWHARRDIWRKGRLRKSRSRQWTSSSGFHS